MKVTDPVCGMQIDPARAVGKIEFEGVIYWFCSESCRREFEAEPSRYTQPK